MVHQDIILLVELARLGREDSIGDAALLIRIVKVWPQVRRMKQVLRLGLPGLRL